MADVDSPKSSAAFRPWIRRLAVALLLLAVARVVGRAGVFPAERPASPWIAAAALFAIRELAVFAARAHSVVAAAVGELALRFGVVVALQGPWSQRIFGNYRVGASSLAALVLLFELLPVAPLPGATILCSFLRRRHPAVIASRLFRRFGSTALALAAAAAISSATVRTDPIAGATAAALSGLSLLALKQERAAAASLDQAPRSGVRRSSSNPASSTTSSNATDQA
jgi:hypothetical protein